jgi:hypothetical protein
VRQQFSAVIQSNGVSSNKHGPLAGASVDAIDRMLHQASDLRNGLARAVPARFPRPRLSETKISSTPRASGGRNSGERLSPVDRDSCSWPTRRSGAIDENQDAGHLRIHEPPSPRRLEEFRKTWSPAPCGNLANQKCNAYWNAEPAADRPGVEDRFPALPHAGALFHRPVGHYGEQTKHAFTSPIRRYAQPKCTRALSKNRASLAPCSAWPIHLETTQLRRRGARQ